MAIEQPSTTQVDAAGEQDEAFHQSEWENVTSDGGVQKKITKTGEGEVPSLHAVCMGAPPFVHFIRLPPDQHHQTSINRRWFTTALIAGPLPRG
jgi:hypothetical protein